MRAIDQRSSIWVGAENVTAEYERPQAELYDLRVASSAIVRRDYWAGKALEAALAGCQVMAKAYQKASDHWAKVHGRYEQSVTGFEVL